jgi:hypothetical protein
MNARVLAVSVIGLMGLAAASHAEAQRPVAAPKQGAFAVELASSLGLGRQLEPESAAKALEAAGIRPDAGWVLDGPATELFVVQIQKGVHLLLQKVSRRLGIPPPPTLNLQVVSSDQLAGQTIVFDREQFDELAAPKTPAAGPAPRGGAEPPREGVQGPESRVEPKQ